MRKSIFLLICCCLIYNSFACTTFFLFKNGQMVFGRNYDWITETGMINTNLRGIRKSSFDDEKGLQWVSKYGSVTFNQYGKEFPTGGMNEKGLVVEMMWLSDTKFPAHDERPSLGVLQWIQYQLDNFSTIDEVLSSDKKIRITSNDAPVHYLVADSKGKVASIEFLNGKMVVHSGNQLPFPVLTNSTYEESVKLIGSSSQNDSLHFQDNSIERFSTACRMVQQYRNTTVDKPLVDYSFDILNSVAQSDWTKWSIVYDITNKKIHFKTAAYPDVKVMDLNTFELSCTTKPMSFNMNQNSTGAINKRFIPYSAELNRRKLKEAFRQSEKQVPVNEDIQNAMSAYADKVKCKL